MRIKKFECEIIKYKGIYEIIPSKKHWFLRFLNIQPILVYGNEKYQGRCISPLGGHHRLKEAEERIRSIKSLNVYYRNSSIC